MGGFLGSADSKEVRQFAGLNAGTLKDSTPHPRGICMSIIPKGLLEGQFASDEEQRGCCEGWAWLVRGNTKKDTTDGHVMSR
jgi:hypothetical protein